MKKIIVSLILCILCLFALISCNEKKEEGKDLLNLCDAQSPYVICRSERAIESERKACTELRKALDSLTGVRLSLITDDALEKSAPALLIGSTRSEISSLAFEGLSENCFRFLEKDGNVAIVSSNPECYALAISVFTEEFASEKGVLIPKGLDRTWQCDEEFGYYEAKNPIMPAGADPFITLHGGVYYYLYSTGSALSLATGPSLDKIYEKDAKQIYAPPSGTMYSKELWAPEMHFIDGRWYIYFAADDGHDENHRMYVLESVSEDPFDGFSFKGQITDPSNDWAIDGTVLSLEGQLYFIWSGRVGEFSKGIQGLYIARMSDPCTISGEKVLIASPEHSFEGSICEGPCIVSREGTVYLLYSGNGSTTPDYCLSYLTLKGNPMNAKSWTKSASPFLSRNALAMGPGHCSALTLPDGNIWIVYHANLEEAGWYGRSVWAQKLSFTEDKKIKLIKNIEKISLPERTFIAREI